MSVLLVAFVTGARLLEPAPGAGTGRVQSGDALLSSGPDTSPWSDPTVLPAHAVPFGAFVGSDFAQDRQTQLAVWLHNADLQVGHTYLPGNNWSDIEGAPSLLGPWAQWRLARPDRVFVLAVPMQAENEAGISDDDVATLLQQAAAGADDAHYQTLARRLVALGVPDTVITLGWEMNGITYTSRCGPDPADWKAYWRRIVEVMRSVPGQQFRFDFTPNRGPDAHPWTDCYPGDNYTDVIGTDNYDQGPGDDFADYVTQPYGLLDQVKFAAQHHKPVSYAEWGMFRHGDDPAFMRSMLNWIETHDTLYQTITDYCPHGVLNCDENPESSAIYQQMMSTQPPPLPTSSPSPSGSPSASVSGSPSASPSAAPGGSASPGASAGASASTVPSPSVPVMPPTQAGPTPAPSTSCHRRRDGDPCAGLRGPAPGGGRPRPGPQPGVTRVKLPGRS
ncbi:glycosyl hydrolase family 26 [Streptacidiphilus pinicola]|uniref:Glycosyl hydrolase family 26 n=2 Tax=Streptacidiphilus pinicola TaxID=2219663 RepID=A0A2X0IJL9_9ACTN|nr:glycosyl hydrolase family 26 [Streptacidiphilus pinicola]